LIDYHAILMTKSPDPFDRSDAERGSKPQAALSGVGLTTERHTLITTLTGNPALRPLGRRRYRSLTLASTSGASSEVEFTAGGEDVTTNRSRVRTLWARKSHGWLEGFSPTKVGHNQRIIPVRRRCTARRRLSLNWGVRETAPAPATPSQDRSVPTRIN